MTPDGADRPAEPAPEPAPARRRVAVLAGRLLLLGSALAVVALVVVRLSSLQELHGVLLAVAGASDLLLAVAAVGALAGALLARGPGAPPAALRALAVALPVVVLVQVCWPSLAGLVRSEDPPPGRSLRVVAQNLWHRNEDPDAAARLVMAEDADVVVLTELTSEHLAAFRRAGAFEEYPHRVLRRRDDTQGMGLLSRHPVEPAVHQPALFRLVASVSPPRSPAVTVVAVHLPAPQRSGAVPYWRRELRAVARDAARAGGPVVVAGDFNAEDGHVRFRTMVERSGLRSAQDHGGGGPLATWPAQGLPVPPLLRLDHVLVGDDVGVSGFGFLPRMGADHLGVRADLVLPRRP